MTLHITVATCPSAEAGSVTLAHDIRLLKAAILYGDQVKLCSLSASLLTLLAGFASLDENQRLSAVRMMSSFLGPNYRNVIAVSGMVEDLQRKRYRTKDELLLLMQARKSINDAWAGIRVKCDEIAKKAGAGGLNAAAESGLLELEVYNQADSDQMVNAFFESAGSAIKSGDTFPLFDDQTGDLIRTAVNEGKLQPGKTGVFRGQIVGLASDLLHRLPLFDDATVEEVIEIRRHLHNPLVRFRSAVITYARAIESAQWDKDFQEEADLVFREKVAPAVMDVEEAVRTNSFARTLLGRATSPLALPPSSAIGVVVSQLAAFQPLLGASLGMAAGGALAVGGAWKEWQNQTSEIERNQLYFYYRAREALERLPSHEARRVGVPSWRS